MFDWFRSLSPQGSASLDKMEAQFEHMLGAGVAMFEAAADALLASTESNAIHERVEATDRELNDLERQIRRELLVHTSLHGPPHMPACLTLMSVLKDAESIGDYAKRVLKLAKSTGSAPVDEYHQDLAQLAGKIADHMSGVREAYGKQDVAQARVLAQGLADLDSHCEVQLSKLLADSAAAHAAQRALSYSMFKRVAAHSMNVATSIFMPLDQIDFLDEQPRPDLPEA